MFCLVLHTIFFGIFTSYVLGVWNMLSLVLIKSQWVSLLTISLWAISVSPAAGSLGQSILTSSSVDSLSFFLATFSGWSVLVSFWAWGPGNNKLLSLNLFFMSLILVLSFSSASFLKFYVFFELSLLPIFLVVLSWGYQPERLSAAFSLLLYTIFSSMPLLVLILYFEKNAGGWGLMASQMAGGEGSLFISVALFLAFLVKLPIFALHHWLPKAHVEAPVFGSMILASILLKLGGYGIARVSPLLVSQSAGFYGVISLSLLGGSIIAFLSLRQMDLKVLIAYSSVAHMGLVSSSFVLNSSWGLSGGLAMMLAHGYISSGMFAGANLIYERSQSRNLLLFKGLLAYSPQFSLFWFFLSMGNMGTPPSLNFISEVFSGLALMGSATSPGLPFFLLGSLAVAFTLTLYAHSQQGLNLNGSSISPLKVREINLFLYHMVPPFMWPLALVFVI